MKKIIKNYLTRAKRKRIKTRQLENQVQESKASDYSYKQFVQAIKELAASGKISPIKARGKNGRRPELYNWYRIETSPPQVDEELKKELLAAYHPRMNLAYYHQHLQEYKRDKKYLQAIDQFLKENKAGKQVRTNERSFQLFNEEKFLANRGQTILRRVGLDLVDLNCSSPAEPFFYYYQENDCPTKNILIIENKDTFFSYKQLLQEEIISWAGIPFSLLIYGEGKKIQQSFSYFEELNYYRQPPAELDVYYFGDLDPEGISIWYQLSSNYEVEFKPACFFYRQLIEHYFESAPNLTTDQTFNQPAVEEFLAYFSPAASKKITKLLKNGKYLPQEGLNYQLLKEISD